VPGADGYRGTGEITSIAFTLPKLASTAGPVLQIVSQAGILTLTWTGSGDLQTTTSLSNAFTTVPNATSPYTVPNDSSTRFYRIQVSSQ
jgi:hypothetical protein